MLVAPAALAAARVVTLGPALATAAPLAWAFESADVRVTPVPVAPDVPTVEIVRVSAAEPESIVIDWPGAMLLTLPTLMFVSPAFAAADSVVATAAPTASVLRPNVTVEPGVFWKRNV